MEPSKKFLIGINNANAVLHLEKSLFSFGIKSPIYGLDNIKTQICHNFQIKYN